MPSAPSPRRRWRQLIIYSAALVPRLHMGRGVGANASLARPLLVRNHRYAGVASQRRPRDRGVGTNDAS